MRAAGWGRIVNFASRCRPPGLSRRSAYGASKGGIGQLTRAMAQAWSSDGITANAIGPGFFRTELTAAVFNDPERAAAQRGANLHRPQWRVGRPGWSPSLSVLASIRLRHRPSADARRGVHRQMKALVYTGPETLAYRDVADPVVARDGEVMVRIDSVGICGSDMHAFLGHDERRPAPLILGHEVSGTDHQRTKGGWPRDREPACYLRSLPSLPFRPGQSLP
jgi:hypothetical protein